MKKNVMMLCIGNYCRSPLAHAILEKHVLEQKLSLEVTVDSSGLGDWHAGKLADSRTRETAREHGIEITHRSRKFVSEDAERSDLIFSMTRAIHEEILAQVPEAHHHKFHVFREFDTETDNEDVPDPYYEGKFEEVHQIIERNCAIILKKILAQEL